MESSAEATPDQTSSVPNLELSPTEASSSSSEEPTEFLLGKGCYKYVNNSDDITHWNSRNGTHTDSSSSSSSPNRTLSSFQEDQTLCTLLEDTLEVDQSAIEVSEEPLKLKDKGQKLAPKVPEKIQNPPAKSEIEKNTSKYHNKSEQNPQITDNNPTMATSNSSKYKYHLADQQTATTPEQMSKEEQAKKQRTISELLAKAAPPKFSSAKEEPIVMSADVFSSVFGNIPGTNLPHHQNDEMDEELGNVSKVMPRSNVCASLIRHSQSVSWTSLIGLIAWDVLHQLFLASPWQVPALIQRILLLAWTGGYTASIPRIRHGEDDLFLEYPKHPTQHYPYSAIPQQPSRPTYIPNVRGMPNFGQTCFLNVVLHALASLDSVLAYVEWIALEQQQRHQREWHEYQQLQSYQRHRQDKPIPTTTASEILLPLLHMANGRPGTIDPRELLWRIAQKNSQFQSKRWGRTMHSSATGEQQDAQELLQALLSMMVVDAQLEKGLEKASSYGEQQEKPLDPSFLEEKKDDHSTGGYDSDSNLTVLSDRWSPRNSSCSSVVYESETDDEVDIHNGAGSGVVIWNGMRMVDTTGKVSSYTKTDTQHKKVTDISPSVVTVESMASSFLSTTSTVVTSPSSSPKQTQSDANLSTSMQIMLSTISSITPSPLCGWEGSVLQCQACHHVRPIENSPFFMIPIVPTSMAMGGPCVSKDSAPPQPCTLTQCLHFYTQIERVNDVECANCTLQKELQELDEEVDLLTLAVESIERRRRQQQKQTKPPTNITDHHHDDALREELKQAELKFKYLQRQDPDNYHPDPPNKLRRSEALKCLILTRCPSVLCLHVQRRFFDPATDRMSKNMQHIWFDETLDLSPFCAYGGEKAAAGFAGRGKGYQMNSDQSQASSIRYRLTCVIEHKGNAFGGHYVCYRRLPGQLQADASSSSKWYFCSDESIQPTTWETVRSCQAYMLLYEAV